ncbi:MAG: T9SS type A sorting domain-containing protein [Ignavibacteriales bacterium]|nr:T9SS type A sorting domain-containing protein [Ignavibacteriales bacterium]
MKKYLVVLLLSFASLINATEFSVYEANYPTVKDYNVNLDEATLVIRPLGNYVEFNLYVTVSYDFKSWFFKNYNELEFKWLFNLPSDAILHEFWYWEGDSIISANVMDKWTAELLFSEISSPLRNPGLLTQSSISKDGQVAHELRIFPVKRNEKRRFKIQYLLPCRPTGNGMRVWLPMNQLISDRTSGLNKLKILYKYENEPYAPTIIGTSLISSSDNTKLAAWEIEIPIEKDQFVELEMPSPIKKDIFLSTYSEGKDNFYQLAVNPPTIPISKTPRNILFVIDFNRFNTSNLDGDFLLSYLKESLQQSLSPADSINIVAAYDNTIWGSDKWVSCTKDELDKLFQKIMMRSFPSYNNLVPLINESVSFLNKQNKLAEVLFLTNTSTINLDRTSQLSLADEIVKKFKPGTKLHFMDLYNSGYLYYNNGYYETQMQSFYGQMSYPTFGNLFFLRYNTLKQMLYSFLYESISHFESVEVQLNFADGYAHSKHFIASHEGYYPLGTPILQIGKFDGKFPVDVNVFGKYRTTTSNYKVTITEDQVQKGNAQIATAWYGYHIQSLLKLPYDPITVSDIISLSIKQNILTPYSGFLILNTNENHGYCTNCKDESGGYNTDVKNESAKDSTLSLEASAYPNPFNPVTTIKYKLPVDGTVKLNIYNLLGENISQLVDLEQQAGTYTSTFNGYRLASGIYIMVLNLDGKSKHYRVTQKLILMK